MADKEVDELSGVETTGHEWDGIKELNNPLPRWWLWTFYATIVWAVGYVIWFPAIPMVTTATTGVSGVTARGTLNDTMADLAEERAVITERILATDLEEIRADDELFRYAVAGGESLYAVNCVQCHGSGAAGGPGYPNLNDDDWIWGGDLENIYLTVAHGVRNEDDLDARFSMMPAFGVDGILSNDEIKAVTAYVLSLSRQEHDREAALEGSDLYIDNCASCHGDDGRGIRDLGAPNLADALWLYGGEPAEIVRQIQNPRHGVMPPWIERLGEAEVKQLAVYIHSLGGGEQAME